MTLYKIKFKAFQTDSLLTHARNKQEAVANIKEYPRFVHLKLKILKIKEVK